MSRLTVERLFGNPPLTVTAPSELKFSPDGSFATCLRPATDDRERLDLWRIDLESGELSLLLDARTLATVEGTSGSGTPTSTLTEAEKAERERKRQFSGGITWYAFAPRGNRLLIPHNGIGYLFELDTQEIARCTPAGTRQTDFHFSPRGRYLSYVRDNDLYCCDIEAGREWAITTDGGELIANGIADFIAAEEMHRFEGHWWSEDESRIAYTRVDESPVEISRRYEIDAETVKVIEQRYPFAGATNASVTLYLYSLAEGRTSKIDYPTAADDYLARVDWAGTALAVQTQSRDQQTLHLDFFDPETGVRRRMLTETSNTWVNLHDNFRHLDAKRFLWTSERDGASRLYLYDSGAVRNLSSGSGRINDIIAADKTQVLCTGWSDSPLEQHLFRINIDDASTRTLTRTPGWHEASADRCGKRVLLRSTDAETPGYLQLLDLESGTTRDLFRQPLAPGHPYHPFIDAHCPPEFGTLEAEDGQTLHYRLTRPNAAPSGNDPSTRSPLVVYVYGGPGAQRVRNEWAPLMLQLFAQRGIGVLELDNRGSSNRGREFEAPIYRRMGNAEVRDQALGARFAQSLNWVDPERIGVFGHSYGGYMTLMCLAQEPDLFKAGVAVAPVARWELYDTHYTERYLATPAQNPDGYERSSVLPWLDTLRGRLLVIHGMADDNVLFTHTTLLIRTLQSMNVSFEMMAYPGSKHSLQEQDVSIHRFNLILDFFERSL